MRSTELLPNHVLSEWMPSVKKNNPVKPSIKFISWCWCSTHFYQCIYRHKNTTSFSLHNLDQENLLLFTTLLFLPMYLALQLRKDERANGNFHTWSCHYSQTICSLGFLCDSEVYLYYLHYTIEHILLVYIIYVLLCAKLLNVAANACINVSREIGQHSSFLGVVIVAILQI